MVYYSLDRIFAALADPTRRALMARLSETDAPVGQRTRQALRDVAAGGDETSRRPVGRRTRHAREDRPHRRVPAARGADARRQRLAQPLPALLERPSRSTRRLPGGRLMSTATTVKPSLTIKRRFKAPPEKVYAAWMRPGKNERWMGPGNVLKVVAECDLRVGGRYHIKMIVTRRRARRLAASIARSCRTKNWFSPGPGNRRRSGSRWSPSPSSRTATAR